MGGERAFLEIDVQEIDDARSEAACKRQRAKLRELYVAERAKLKAVLKKVPTKPVKAPKKPKTTTLAEKKKVKLATKARPTEVKLAPIPHVAVASSVKTGVSKPTKAAFAFASKVSSPARFQLKISASGLRWARPGEENQPHTHPGLALLLRCLKPPTSPASTPSPVAPSPAVPSLGHPGFFPAPAVPAPAVGRVTLYEAGMDAPLNRSVVWEAPMASQREGSFHPFSPLVSAVIERHYQEWRVGRMIETVREFRDLPALNGSLAPCWRLDFEGMRVLLAGVRNDKIRRREVPE